LAQIEALDLLDALLDDPSMHFSMRLQPGDIQFVYNHTLHHDRSAFQDHADPALVRHCAPPGGLLVTDGIGMGSCSPPALLRPNGYAILTAKQETLVVVWQRRHLWRLWLAPPQDRPLPEYFATRWGSTEAGARGGILCPGTTPSVPRLS
jgi:hypothetical protein